MTQRWRDEVGVPKAGVGLLLYREFLTVQQRELDLLR